MNVELEDLIKEQLAAGRYADAARLAANLANVIARELWFDQIADAQVAAYVEQMEEEKIHQESTIPSPWSVWSSDRLHRRHAALFQEKNAYDNAYA